MTKNVAASVHQRLLNLARAEGRVFNEVLQRFALERFLYRLGSSRYRSRFILKGAWMLSVWQVPLPRPTRDIDLLGRLASTVENIASAVQGICETSAPADGLYFDTKDLVSERITETANYAGVRVRFVAYLGKARVPMRIDVGFGDPVVPDPSAVQLPALLDFPPPELLGYSRESTIAEKYQAMVYLGMINSRMKDFFDIWLLASHTSFRGPLLAQAIEETFRWRTAPLVLESVALSDAFALDSEKEAQ